MGKPITPYARQVLHDFRLSFGAYQGKPISAVPPEYLTWAIANSQTIPAGDAWAIKTYVTAALGGKRRKNRKRPGQRSPGREQRHPNGNGQGAADQQPRRGS